MLVSAVVALVAGAGSFLFFRRRQEMGRGSAPPGKWQPWIFGVLAFMCGSLFHLLSQFGGTFLPASAIVAGLLLLPVMVILTVRSAQKAGGWSSSHTDALVLGGLLVYCWLGFFLTARLHGTGTLAGQFFPALIVLALVYVRLIRRRT